MAELSASGIIVRTMQLFFSPTSPYARKVLVAARETGLDSRIELIAINPWDSASGIGQKNPLAKVPVLILQDDTELFDSPVICEYLNSLLADSGLIHASRPERWHVLRRQALADGMMDAAVLIFLETNRRPQGERSRWWLDLQLQTLRDSVAALESQVPTFTEPPDIGQIAVGCALGYLDFRITDLDWRGGAPRLSSWFQRFSQRPSMQTSAPSVPT